MIKYLDIDYNIVDEKGKKNLMFQLFFIKNNTIEARFPILCSIFKKEIYIALKNKWPDKLIFISFKEDVKMEYHPYRAFKRKLLGLDP